MHRRRAGTGGRARPSSRARTAASRPEASARPASPQSLLPEVPGRQRNSHRLFGRGTRPSAVPGQKPHPRGAGQPPRPHRGARQHANARRHHGRERGDHRHPGAHGVVPDLSRKRLGHHFAGRRTGAEPGDPRIGRCGGKPDLPAKRSDSPCRRLHSRGCPCGAHHGDRVQAEGLRVLLPRRVCLCQCDRRRTLAPHLCGHQPRRILGRRDSGLVQPEQPARPH